MAQGESSAFYVFFEELVMWLDDINSALKIDDDMKSLVIIDDVLKNRVYIKRTKC